MLDRFFYMASFIGRLGDSLQTLHDSAILVEHPPRL